MSKPGKLGTGLSSALEWYRYGRYPYLLAKLAFFAAMCMGVLWALRQVEAVLAPVLVALGLAYLLDPVVDRFEKRGYSRTSGIALILMFTLVGGAVFMLILYPTIAGLVGKAATGIPALATMATQDGIPWIERVLFPWIHDTFSVPTPDIEEILTGFTGQLDESLKQAFNWAARIAQNLLNTGIGLAAGAINLVMIPIFTFYFLRDFDKMRLGMVEYIPPKQRELVLDRVLKMDVVVGAWFRGQVEVALILAVLYSLGLSLTFGLSGIGATSGIAIGILSGLLNIVPYLGFAIGFGLSVLLAVLDWHGWMPLLGVLAVFSLVQGLEGYVVTPRIVGEKVGLSPVVVIISLLLGGELLGLVGVLLALPIAGIIRVLLPDFVAAYKRSSLFTGEPNDPPLED